MSQVTRDLKKLDVRGLARKLGIIRDERHENKIWIDCPWEHEHSSYTGPGETALLLPGHGFAWPGFRCLHEHCAHRTIADFLAHVDEAAPGLVDQFCGRRQVTRATKKEKVAVVWPPPV